MYVNLWCYIGDASRQHSLSFDEETKADLYGFVDIAVVSATIR